jgi:hypothetical protein
MNGTVCARADGRFSEKFRRPARPAGEEKRPKCFEPLVLPASPFPLKKSGDLGLFAP